MKNIPIFGWEELNLISFEIIKRDLTVEDGKEPDFTAIGEELMYPLVDGRWFKTFGAAKKAALETLRSDINILRYAARTIKAQKKP